MPKQDLKLITCRICGLVMVKLSRDVCNPCFQKEEDLFLRIKDFVRANPKATVREVGDSLGISDDQINYFIRTGRLERLGVNIEHACQTCGRIITTGLICSECSEELKKQVGSLKTAMGKLKAGGKDVSTKDRKPNDGRTDKGKK